MWVSGSDKKHNRLLHEQKGDNRTGVQQNSNSSYSMPVSSGLISIVRVTLNNPDTGMSVRTCALQDSGATVTLINKNLKEWLNLSAKESRPELSGMNSAINLNEKVSVKVTTRNLKPERINCLVQPDLSLGSTSYAYSFYKKKDFFTCRYYQIAKYRTLK